MKRLYHISITSHNEVITRNRDDVRTITNILAVAGWRNNCEILSDAIMSTHIHLVILSEYPRKFVASFLMSLSKWFNHKYGRKGTFGDKRYFILELDGMNHIVTCLCYVLKNGVHHFQAPTAFAYKDCTTPFLFAKELGREPPASTLTSRSDIRPFLPKRCDFPDYFVADMNGTILRSSFEEIVKTEGYFSRVNNFLQKMARSPNDRRWKDEQETDDTASEIISLKTVEPGYDVDDIRKMEIYGDGYYYHPKTMSDMDVCCLIDNTFLPPLNVSSIYSLSTTQISNIARSLKYEFHLPEKQIARCLATNYK